ncbi:hypothetical protein [Streptomyces chromofuscus]|uniref:Lipoprotein n=1 Tax=Streptomyces chromofuscus TaxID=42881 RepID=A0A7M2TEB0_STRCW|nr:hypothetical protein [Streptomyces chromofuscus]QOV47077.1 hypothetical protein IPT68_15070 [Streptomyces chromofuscus]GGT26177.1 lipoprotein [Streptomyces chromofuscus]
MRRTTLVAICIAVGATVGLTACLPGQDAADSKPSASAGANGSGASGAAGEPFAGLTGGEIADKALDATTAASSLRVTGDVPDEETGGTIHIDMAMNKRNECAGTMSMDEGKADLIKTGDTIYMRYDEAFLRAQSKGEAEAEVDAVVDMLAGKWTKTSATGEDAMDIASFCDLDTMLGGAEDVNSDATRGKTTTVDGSPAITLREKDGKDRYTVYVATEGKPYLLRLDSSSAGERGTLVFSDFDEPVPAQKPSGEVLDLDELG